MIQSGCHCKETLSLHIAERDYVTLLLKELLRPFSGSRGPVTVSGLTASETRTTLFDVVRVSCGSRSF